MREIKKTLINLFMYNLLKHCFDKNISAEVIIEKKKLLFVFFKAASSDCFLVPSPPCKWGWLVIECFWWGGSTRTRNRIRVSKLSSRSSIWSSLILLQDSLIQSYFHYLIQIWKWMGMENILKSRGSRVNNFLQMEFSSISSSRMIKPVLQTNSLHQSQIVCWRPVRRYLPKLISSRQFTSVWHNPHGCPGMRLTPH